MLKPHSVLALGLWIIAVNLLGISSSWKIRLYVLTGVVLVVVYLYRLGQDVILRLARQQQRSADTFTENGVKSSGQNLGGHAAP